jgi:uncharacterized iron-regulated membrane protein
LEGEVTVNTWHRRIAITAVVLLALTAVTGILWAYAPHLYFQDGYLKKKTKFQGPALSRAKISQKDALEAAVAVFNTEKGLETVSLRAEAAHLVYEVIRKDGKEQQSVLIDAISGDVLSPISDKFAVEIAAQYVAGNPPVKGAEALDEYKHRSGKKIKMVYRVAFTAPGNPEIFIDRNSGTIVEESDRSRVFHFWVMKLHQLQFFGVKKEFTIIPGLALIFLIITGTVMWVRRYRATA